MEFALVSLHFSWFDLLAVNAVWSYSVSLGLTRTHTLPEGRREESQSRKGKGPIGNFEPVQTLHSDRARTHARTETEIGSPVKLNPATSDVSHVLLQFSQRLMA